MSAFQFILLLKLFNLIRRQFPTWFQPGGSEAVERESILTVQADIQSLAVALLSFDCGDYLVHLIQQSHGLGETTASMTASNPKSRALPKAERSVVSGFYYILVPIIRINSSGLASAEGEHTRVFVPGGI